MEDLDSRREGPYGLADDAVSIIIVGGSKYGNVSGFLAVTKLLADCRMERRRRILVTAAAPETEYLFIPEQQGGNPNAWADADRYGTETPLGELRSRLSDLSGQFRKALLFFLNGNEKGILGMPGVIDWTPAQEGITAERAFDFLEFLNDTFDETLVI